MLHKEAVHLLLRKNIVCRAIRKVVAALNTLLNVFVVFPSFLPTQNVNEVSYTLSGKENLSLKPQSGRVEVARQFLISACGVLYVKFKKSQFLCHMEYLFTEGYGIIFLCLFQT